MSCTKWWQSHNFWMKDEVVYSALLQLCVTSLGTTRSYNPRHHLLFSMKTHLRQFESYQVFNRQADSDETNRYYSLDIGILCTNGVYNDGVRIYQRCNDSFATVIEGRCTPNSMGGFCSADDFTGQWDIERACDYSNSTCSSEYRDALVSIRSEEGCCTISQYLATTTVKRLHFILQQSLQPYWLISEIWPRILKNFQKILILWKNLLLVKYWMNLLYTIYIVKCWNTEIACKILKKWSTLYWNQSTQVGGTATEPYNYTVWSNCGVEPVTQVPHWWWLLWY